MIPGYVLIASCSWKGLRSNYNSPFFFFNLYIFKYYRIILSPCLVFLRKYLCAYPGWAGINIALSEPLSVCCGGWLVAWHLTWRLLTGVALGFVFPVRIVFPFTGIHWRLVFSWCGECEADREMCSLPWPGTDSGSKAEAWCRMQESLLPQCPCALRDPGAWEEGRLQADHIQ